MEDTRKHAILEACHDSRFGGCHFGRDKTTEKVSSRYYWKGLHKDVEEWVSVLLRYINLIVNGICVQLGEAL